MITKVHQADDVLQNGDADAIFLGREFLRDPYWPLHAAKELDTEIHWPHQYLRAK
jgi:2,4-dienoyl-CoA reductase-like NADH-dependent reductase (Old Yellow Enzyme family)